MDDHGNDEDVTSDELLELTPKGFFTITLGQYGATSKQSEEEWYKFEAFCIRKVADSEASHAALVFDGEGGCVVGADLKQVEEFD